MNTLTSKKAELAAVVADMAETMRVYNPTLASAFVSNVFQRENLARAFVAGFSAENGVAKLINLQIRMMVILKSYIKMQEV